MTSHVNGYNEFLVRCKIDLNVIYLIQQTNIIASVPLLTIKTRLANKKVMIDTFMNHNE